MEKEQFDKYFRNVPVSVNNLYWDPFFPFQVENTFEKLESLKKSNHEWIVSIITKSEISEDIAKRLEKYKEYLKLVILVSISWLPNKKIENQPYEMNMWNRYKTLEHCDKYKIPAIAYVRPFIPPYNTSPECIENIFKSVSESGVKNMVISWLRWNDEILLNSGISEKELEKRSFRVKIIPQDVRQLIDLFKKKYNITVFERTSCGATYVTWWDFSYNQYQASPQLAKCFECPMKSTCFDKRDENVPSDLDLEFVRFLWYDAHINIYNRWELCKVNPFKRTECESCCTSCYKLLRNSIELDNVDDNWISLWDTSMLRLLTWKLVFWKWIREIWDKNVAYPNSEILKWLPIYMVNSRRVYSRSIPHCYNCSYCMIWKYYKDNMDWSEYWSNPMDVADLLRKKIKDEKKQ